MKSKIMNLMLLPVIVMGILTACDDNKDEFLSDFSTIVYILNSGEQDITLYKTGENTSTNLTINKAGSNRKTSASAVLGVLSETELEAYNTGNYTSFKKLPDNCYEIPANTSVSFSGENDSYKTLDIIFKTDEIYNLGDLTDYVLPLGLSSPDSVNAQKRVVLYKPTVIIPTVYFDRTGYNRNDFEEGGDTEMSFSLPVTLPIQNKWNFTCTVEIDEALLDEYNQENGLSYALLPQESYTIAQDGIVTFTEADDLKNLNISVSNAQLDYGNYVLPLRLTDCSKETFLIDPQRNSCLYGISYIPNAESLQSLALTASMLSSNAVEPSEGSLANLLDGDITTYFHSAWSVAVDGHHYLQVNLDKEYTAFSFRYIGRSSGAAGNPGEIVLMGSLDGVNFAKIDQINEGLPTTGGAGEYNSPVLVAQPFRYLRLVVTRNVNGGSFFVFSEFSMKGL